MHDDLFKIIDAMKSKALLDEGDTIAFVTGLKLFGDALFQKLKPQFASFMKELKSGSGCRLARSLSGAHHRAPSA